MALLQYWFKCWIYLDGFSIRHYTIQHQITVPVWPCLWIDFGLIVVALRNIISSVEFSLIIIQSDLISHAIVMITWVLPCCQAHCKKRTDQANQMMDSTNQYFASRYLVPPWRGLYKCSIQAKTCHFGEDLISNCIKCRSLKKEYCVNGLKQPYAISQVYWTHRLLQIFVLISAVFRFWNIKDSTYRPQDVAAIKFFSSSLWRKL